MCFHGLKPGYVELLGHRVGVCLVLNETTSLFQSDRTCHTLTSSVRALVPWTPLPAFGVVPLFQL